MSAPHDGLHDAMLDLRKLAHFSVILLERRIEDGTATDEEELIVRGYHEAYVRMAAERIGIDNNLAAILS